MIDATIGRPLRKAKYEKESLERIPRSTFEKLTQVLGYCFDRWEDEKQYEDFREYREHITKRAKMIDVYVVVIDVPLDDDKLTEIRFNYRDGSKHQNDLLAVRINERFLNPNLRSVQVDLKFIL